MAGPVCLWKRPSNTTHLVGVYTRRGVSATPPDPLSILRLLLLPHPLPAPLRRTPTLAPPGAARSHQRGFYNFTLAAIRLAIPASDSRKGISRNFLFTECGPSWTVAA